MVKKEPRRGTAGARFEEAAERVAAEIRRLDDVGDDVRRRVGEIRWAGRSAEQFRRHARYQATRVGNSREVLESLRVLLLQAARSADAKVGATP
jgi:hypothetical protein